MIELTHHSVAHGMQGAWQTAQDISKPPKNVTRRPDYKCFHLEFDQKEINMIWDVTNYKD